MLGFFYRDKKVFQAVKKVFQREKKVFQAGEKWNTNAAISNADDTDL